MRVLYTNSKLFFSLIMYIFYENVKIRVKNSKIILILKHCFVCQKKLVYKELR